jgi:hypothetical protein
VLDRWSGWSTQGWKEASRRIFARSFGTSTCAHHTRCSVIASTLMAHHGILSSHVLATSLDAPDTYILRGHFKSDHRVNVHSADNKTCASCAATLQCTSCCDDSLARMKDADEPNAYADNARASRQCPLLGPQMGLASSRVESCCLLERWS